MVTADTFVDWNLSEQQFTRKPTSTVEIASLSRHTTVTKRNQNECNYSKGLIFISLSVGLHNANQ